MRRPLPTSGMPPSFLLTMQEREERWPVLRLAAYNGELSPAYWHTVNVPLVVRVCLSPCLLMARCLFMAVSWHQAAKLAEIHALMSTGDTRLPGPVLCLAHFLHVGHGCCTATCSLAIIEAYGSPECLQEPGPQSMQQRAPARMKGSAAVPLSRWRPYKPGR